MAVNGGIINAVSHPVSIIIKDSSFENSWSSLSGSVLHYENTEVNSKSNTISFERCIMKNQSSKGGSGAFYLNSEKLTFSLIDSVI